MTDSIEFRPNADDVRILHEAARDCEHAADTLRRALRLLDHERWIDQFRSDAAALGDEDLNEEPEAW